MALETSTQYSKSEREKKILYNIAYMWNLEKLCKWSYLQSRSRDTDVETTYGSTGGRDSKMDWETGMDLYTLLGIEWGLLLLWWLSSQESNVKNPVSPTMQEMQVWRLGHKDPWRRKWQPTPTFLSWKSHGQRSRAGYSPWGCKSQTHLVTKQPHV